MDYKKKYLKYKLKYLTTKKLYAGSNNEQPQPPAPHLQPQPPPLNLLEDDNFFLEIEQPAPEEPSTPPSHTTQEDKQPRKGKSPKTPPHS